MKQQNSEKSSEHSRTTVPLLLQGRRMIRKSAKKAGATATRVARKSRRIVGQTVERTKMFTRRSPWKGLGTALATGLFVGALTTWLITKD